MGNLGREYNCIITDFFQIQTSRWQINPPDIDILNEQLISYTDAAKETKAQVQKHQKCVTPGASIHESSY